MKAVVNYFRDSILELRKVDWPSRPEVVRHTLIVAVSVGIATIIVGVIDFGLARLLEFLVNRTG